MTEAANYAQLGATPLTYQPYTQANINQYYSPFQNDVVSSTEAQLNQQNQVQQNQLKGSAIGSGAWGGDRSAAAQALLGGQQQLAEAPTIAGLENTGFANAQGQFNTMNQTGLAAQQGTNQANQAASYALGSLGPTIQNTALQGAGALLGAGTTQQQVAQENLNVPYEQWLAQQAYPYQSLDFLASMLPGIAQGTGVQTTANQSTSPSLFGIPIRSGGRVRSLATGGLPYPDPFDPASPTVPNPSTSYIPPSTGTGSGFSFGQGQGGVGGDTSSGGGSGTNPLTLGGASSLLFGNPATSPGSYASSGLLGSGGLGSALFGNAAGSSTGVTSGWLGTGGLDATLSGVGDAISSGVSGIGDALAAIFAKDGGRVGMDDGGNPSADADKPLVINAVDPGELRRGGRPRHLADSGDTGDGDDAPTFDNGAPVYPAANDNTLANTAPVSQPAWDNGQPVNSGMKEVIPAHEPSIWPALLAGLGGLFGSDHPIGSAISAGMNEYEKDANPTVDHSGASMLVHYANGPTFDTGIPTEAALNAQAMNAYRLSNMDMNKQTREDAIKQRDEAAAERAAEQQAAIEERAAAAHQADLDRQQQLKIAEMNAEAGRWSFVGTDPATQKPIMLDARTGQTTIGDMPIAAKPLAPRPQAPLTQSAALQAAQRDYDRFYPAPKPNPNDPTKDIYGNPLAPRQVPPEGMQAWLQKRAKGYMTGVGGNALPGQQAAPASPAAPGSQTPPPANANTPPPKVQFPPRPTGVPPAAKYSPSTKSYWWQKADGTWAQQAA